LTIHRVVLAAAVPTILFIGWYFWELHYSPGLAVVDSLDRLRAAQASDQEGKVVQALIESLRQNYVETRQDATRWSAVFWGATFFGLLASASGALILKLESLKLTDVQRKDWGAVLAGAAALAVSLAASGDFRQKWQANRLAAGELERRAYKLLAEKNPSVSEYYEAIADIQFKRTTLITGKEDPAKPASSGAGASVLETKARAVEAPRAPSESGH
jgi:hypothetical protein